MNANKRQALVLMAHADDETLGAGGTILHMLATGWEVNVVLLTDGKIATRSTGIDDNRSAAFEACEILGCNPPTILGFADQKFDNYPIADIANEVFQLNLEPDLIITHSPFDLNGDHKITYEVAMIIGRPRYRRTSILSAEIPKNNFWNGRAFNPNYFVDVSDYMDAKLQAFEAYKNEAKEYPHAFSTGGLKLLAEYHGFHSGYGLAEGFNVVRGYSDSLP